MANYKWAGKGCVLIARKKYYRGDSLPDTVNPRRIAQWISEGLVEEEFTGATVFEGGSNAELEEQIRSLNIPQVPNSDNQTEVVTEDSTSVNEEKSSEEQEASDEEEKPDLPDPKGNSNSDDQPGNEEESLGDELDLSAAAGTEQTKSPQKKKAKAKSPKNKKRT